MEGRHRAASSSTSRRACHVVHCGGSQVTCIVGCPEADGGHGRIPEGSLPSSKPWDWPPGPDWSRSTSLWFHQPWTSAGQLYPWGTTSPTHSCVVVPGHFHSVPRAHKPPPSFLRLPRHHLGGGNGVRMKSNRSNYISGHCLN